MLAEPPRKYNLYGVALSKQIVKPGAFSLGSQVLTFNNISVFTRYGPKKPM